MLDIVVCEIAGLERHCNPVHAGSGAFLCAKSGWCRNASGSGRHEGATIKRCHTNLPDFIKARRRPSQRCATTSSTEHPNASPLAELCKPASFARFGLV